MINDIKLKTVEELKAEKQLPKYQVLIKVGNKIIQLKNKFGIWHV